MSEYMDKSNVDLHSFMGYMILHCMTEHARILFPDDTASVFKVPGWEHLQDRDQFLVSFQIDGIEVPFFSFSEHLEKEFERKVEAAASELLEERMARSFEKLDEVTESVCLQLRDSFDLKENDETQPGPTDSSSKFNSAQVSQLLESCIAPLIEAAGKWGDQKMVEKLRDVENKLGDLLHDGRFRG